MITLIFSKEDHSDIVMTENDLFDWSYEHSCFSGDTFELGGVNAKSLYLLIDNSEHRFTRGNLSHTRIELLIDGEFMGYFNTNITKHRNGTIELYAYDDMLKFDTEYPTTYDLPATFNQMYARCIFEAGLAEDRSFDHIVNNGCFDSGIISHEYADYIYANSCRQLVAGMAEWNGGFCFINDEGKLQVQPFSKEVSAEFSSGELMEFDYSDETLVFTKVKSSFKTKTYELGTDDGYTLVINNQYIQYGLDDYSFEVMLGKIHEYYNGFTLTPMSFTLATPNLSLRIGDRISVYDEEEGVTVVSNISKIQITGNLLMQVTCGGFSTETINNCGSTSASQTNQSKTNAAQENSALIPASISSYSYIDDNTVCCDGVTYTIEKDSVTGLISKITNSDGNELTPELSSEVTDISLHNAVFWALCMARGIGSSQTLMPVIELLFNNSLENTGTGDYTIASSNDSAEVLYADRLNGKCYSATNASSIVIADVSELLQSDFTITFWTKIEDNGLAPYAKWRRFVWWNVDTNYRGFELMYNSSGTTNVPSFVYEGGSLGVDTDRAINDGAWHSISIVQRRSSIITTVDGVDQIIVNNVGITDAKSKLYLSEVDYVLNGYISSFRVYNKALSDVEIRQVLALK